MILAKDSERNQCSPNDQLVRIKYGQWMRIQNRFPREGFQLASFWRLGQRIRIHYFLLPLGRSRMKMTMSLHRYFFSQIANFLRSRFSPKISFFGIKPEPRNKNRFLNFGFRCSDIPVLDILQFWYLWWKNRHFLNFEESAERKRTVIWT